jgi:citrate lyase subunit beta/citryl-CoA lyase
LDARTVILHRSILFVPGGREAMVEKASRFPADILCLDLEESVLPEEKAHARQVVRDAIAPLQVLNRTVHVRINSIRSEQTRDDLAAVVQPGLDAVLLAKTESSQDVRSVDVFLREQEMEHQIRPGTIGLIVAVESAQALLRCEVIAGASTRIAALMLGGEDFTFDMGVERTPEGRELEHARAVVATCARAAGVIALDTPWTDIADIQGLEADAARAKRLGFAGKYVIHPSHIGPVQEVFSPEESDITRARSVWAAWESARNAGTGAVQLDGRMIDRPVAERARRILEQAAAIAAAKAKG